MRRASSAATARRSTSAAMPSDDTSKAMIASRSDGDERNASTVTSASTAKLPTNSRPLR